MSLTIPALTGLRSTYATDAMTALSSSSAPGVKTPFEEVARKATFLVSQASSWLAKGVS
ncbi:MAG: hypothetical protein ACI8Z1_000880 [Candidatus Azotimanducaceae bacterium]|jgi:hypothetical protein